MVSIKMKNLIILDLDNTLIYGTSNPGLSATILFQFSRHLIIYERPQAKEFVRKCHEVADVVVFTTAEREYAQKVCDNLDINPYELFTREDCLIENGWYIKSISIYYFDIYDQIIIIDDIPEIWDKVCRNRSRIIKVTEFTGDIKDDELGKIKLSFRMDYDLKKECENWEHFSSNFQYRLITFSD